MICNEETLSDKVIAASRRIIENYSKGASRKFLLLVVKYFNCFHDLFMSYQLEEPDGDPIILTPYVAENISTHIFCTIGNSLKYLLLALHLQNSQTIDKDAF